MELFSHTHEYITDAVVTLCLFGGGWSSFNELIWTIAMFFVFKLLKSLLRNYGYGWVQWDGEKCGCCVCEWLLSVDVEYVVRERKSGENEKLKKKSKMKKYERIFVKRKECHCVPSVWRVYGVIEICISMGWEIRSSVLVAQERCLLFLLVVVLVCLLHFSFVKVRQECHRNNIRTTAIILCLNRLSSGLHFHASLLRRCSVIWLHAATHQKQHQTSNTQ